MRLGGGRWGGGVNFYIGVIPVLTLSIRTFDFYVEFKMENRPIANMVDSTYKIHETLAWAHWLSLARYLSGKAVTKPKTASSSPSVDNTVPTAPWATTRSTRGDSPEPTAFWIYVWATSDLDDRGFDARRETQRISTLYIPINWRNCFRFFSSSRKIYREFWVRRPPPPVFIFIVTPDWGFQLRHWQCPIRSGFCIQNPI